MADVVFILGAGCSKEAGAPTSYDFLDRARDLYASGQLQSRREEFELLFEAVGYLQRVHSKAKLDITNLESVFSALDIGWTLRKLPGIEDESKIERVLSAMRWVIVKTLEHSINFPVRDTVITAPHGYQGLADVLQKLGNRRPPLSAAVISFNYDICMDVALDDSGIPFTYALDGGGGGAIPLLKLHGSMNWARNTERQQVFPWSVREYRQNYRLQFPSRDVTSIHAPVSEQMFKALNGSGIDPLPVLVPPLINKGDEQRQLWRVWQRAAKELAQASYVIVIGYSLPETDQFFRMLFALGTESSVPLRKLLVLNPDPDGEVDKRFRAMLGESALSRFEFERFVFTGTPSIIKAALAI
jgi:hypothetical protein